MMVHNPVKSLTTSAHTRYTQQNGSLCTKAHFREDSMKAAISLVLAIYVSSSVVGWAYAQSQDRAKLL